MNVVNEGDPGIRVQMGDPKPDITSGVIWHGIDIPPLPLSEIPLTSPDLRRFPMPDEYPWLNAIELLQAQANRMSAKATDLVVTESAHGVDADLSLALHKFAKTKGITPGEEAREMADTFAGVVDGLSVRPTENGYLNFEFEPSLLAARVLAQIEEEGEGYGNENLGDGKTVVMDVSSPNVAKYMSVGHLRSTVIGESLARIYKASGYEVIRDNHLGDWGTQFGILGHAIELWGEEIDQQMPDAEPVQKLYTLYVRMNSGIAEEKKQDLERLMSERDELLAVDPGAKIDSDDVLARRASSALEQQGKDWFRRLEEGDPEALELLRTATSQSLQEFQRVYYLLGSKFEYVLGESFYVDMLPDVTKAFLENSTARIGTEGKDTGAVVVDMDEPGIDRLVIRKSDGASVYATRDLAALAARTAWFDPDKILYVVGGDQKSYFRQVFSAFKQFAHDEAPNLEHISFGMISLPEGKMSTRQGRVVFLEDVLYEAISRARTKVESMQRADDEIEVEGTHDPHVLKHRAKLSSQEIRDVSRQVGVGAVIYMDLGQGRERNIEFDIDKALSLETNSAPYIQYAHARAKSLLRKAGEKGIEPDFLGEVVVGSAVEVELVKQLAKFPIAIRKALESNEPSVISAYVYKVADLFSKFYKGSPVLAEEDKSVRNTRLRLTAASAQVIKNGLYLLGIEAPEKM